MDYDALLRTVAHRPWPLPKAPWIMVQFWHDLLFAHWPIAAEIMREHVPPELPLDTFDGQCWIGIVPFHMSNVRPRYVPPIPGLSRFPELNVRTYVALNGKPGVYFFSLDAASLPAVWAARAFYHLPYFYAEMNVAVQGHEVTYDSRRRQSAARLQTRYRPTAPVQFRQRETLEHWLTERYCLYTVHDHRVFRGEIHHRPWPLQDAEAEFTSNSMAGAAGIDLPQATPLLHFSRLQRVLIWPLAQVT
ncbi:MAG TPA: DUF2071 domain-containing protein [Terriglobales bacterium]|nr:DUF2071 domain-containing protein [Terriglobales bacterium]